MSTPASTSTTSEEKSTPTQSAVVRKYNTNELIGFLREQEDLELDDSHFETLRNEEITGRAFLQMTEEKFIRAGLKMGPALVLADFAKEVKEKKLKPYSSYRTVKDLHEVLKKHGIDSKNIADIPQFKPDIHKLYDDNVEFLHCIKEIKHRLGNMGTVVDNNEAMRCEYISSILHSAIRIVKNITKKKITISPQFEVIGEENTGRVDYAIKKIPDDTNILEELACITEGKQYQVSAGFAQNLMQCMDAQQTNKRKRKLDEAFGDLYYDYLYGIVSTGSDWYFILYTSEDIWCTSKSEYHISLTEASLNDDTKLCQGVKEVMEVIVGLLKDRVSVNDEPATKRHCVEGKTKG